jgi:hypothetical protein
MMFTLCSICQMTDTTSPNEPALPTAFTASRQCNGWTVERQRAFCEALATCGIVERAAASVGMTRQGAYAFKLSTAGRAFALAWDAALLLARQGMIDDAYELAFEGSVERIYRDGKLVQEKRKRDPKMLLATIERLGSKAALGTGPVVAVAQEFAAFLDAMEAEASGQRGATGEFMECRAEWGGAMNRSSLKDSSDLLRRATLAAPAVTPPRLEDRRLA